MSAVAWLRAYSPSTTSEQAIPKRREGEEELELALLPFLDETVRREARIELALDGQCVVFNVVRCPLWLAQV